MLFLHHSLWKSHSSFKIWTKGTSLHLPRVPILSAFLPLSSIRMSVPLLCNSQPTPLPCACLGDSTAQLPVVDISGWWSPWGQGFYMMPVHILPGAQCNASHTIMSSRNVSWVRHDSFLVRWAVFGEQSSQMETVGRIFSSLSPIVHSGLHSVVTSASLYLSVPSLRSASPLLPASSLCRAPWKQGLCTTRML